MPPARDRFLSILRTALENGALEKLTLGKPRGADPTLRNLFIRPVALKTGPHLTFLWRHAARDITKNHPPAEALAEIDALLGRDFLDAHLFTTTESAQLETQPDGAARLRIKANRPASAAPHPPRAPSHDRTKSHLIPANAPWLRALGITNDRAQPREGMADKFRQIQKFAELLTHLLAEAFPDATTPLHIADMGSGKGYLTFALAALLSSRAHVTGIEARPELVDLCNRIAREQNFPHLNFTSARIADFQIPRPVHSPAPADADPQAPADTDSQAPADAHSQITNLKSEISLPALDVLIALHACDTATDDALAKGIAAGARLLVVSPCCQKELRPQLTAPPVLADALQHGIFQERQAEFVTDALRAQLLECAGYRTRVFEFISTEHTAKNLMIAAIKSSAPVDPARPQRLRDFAAFYGIHHQRLATHLGFSLRN